MLSSDAELNDSSSEAAIKPLAIAGSAMLALLDTDPSARVLNLASDSSVKLALKEPDYFTK